MKVVLFLGHSQENEIICGMLENFSNDKIITLGYEDDEPELMTLAPKYRCIPNSVFEEFDDKIGDASMRNAYLYVARCFKFEDYITDLVNELNEKILVISNYYVYSLFYLEQKGILSNFCLQAYSAIDNRIQLKNKNFIEKSVSEIKELSARILTLEEKNRDLQERLNFITSHNEELNKENVAFKLKISNDAEQILGMDKMLKDADLFNKNLQEHLEKIDEDNKNFAKELLERDEHIKGLETVLRQANAYNENLIEHINKLDQEVNEYKNVILLDEKEKEQLKILQRENEQYVEVYKSLMEKYNEMMEIKLDEVLKKK